MGGVGGAPGGEPLDVDGRVRAAGAPVDVVDEAGEEVRPPGLAGLEALKARVEAVVGEAQLGAGAGSPNPPADAERFAAWRAEHAAR